VACDSQDRVFVYSRSEHPLLVFDREGRFLEEWGAGVLEDAHGIFIDDQDNVFCTERNTHCMHKFDRNGKLVLTIGTPGRPGARDGDPFNLPTDVGVASTGELFISDGYGNARVHKYSPDGELIMSWGEWGTGPGQFNLSHAVRVDSQDRVWVCDRTNDRIQIFDTEGRFLTEWAGITKPDTLHFDPAGDVLYLAGLEQEVSVYSMDGELLTSWGGGRPSSKPGEFLACPHGIWSDSRGDLYVGQVQVDGQLQKFIRQ
jgi:streptogramin lyase